MFQIAQAYVSIKPDLGGFSKDLNRQVSSSSAGLESTGKQGGKKYGGGFAAAAGGALKGGLAGLAAGLAAVPIAKFFADGVKGASDLSESTSKAKVVFGGASDGVLKFAENAATGLGQSKTQALEAVGVFGNLLRSTGLSADASAGMSTKMVQLASDMASFNNASPEETLDALRAGLVGETEPLKRFGVNLNEAAIKAEAMKLGLYGGTGALSSAAKAQASYSLITQQTSLAQGDFARTSGGLANQQRIAAAQWSDLKTRIGAGLLPVLTRLMVFITGTVLPGITSMGGWVRKVFSGDFAGAQAGVTNFVNSLGGKLGQLGPRVGAWMMAAGRKLVDWIGPQVGPALAATGAFFGRLVGWWYGTALPWLGRATWALGQKLVDWIGPRVGPMLAAARDFLGRAVTWFDVVGRPWLTGTMSRLGGKLVDWVGPKIPAFLGQLGAFLGRGVVWLVGTGLPRLTGALLKLGGELLKWVLPRIPGLIGDFTALIGKVVGWVATRGVPWLVGSLFGLGKGMVKGMLDGWKTTDIGRFFTGVWTGIQHIWRLGVAGIKKMFFTAVGEILDGAAEMMGWVPGLGPKLREASGKIATFRDAANREFDKIQDENIDITAKYSIQQVMATEASRDAFKSAAGVRIRRSGGPVVGPGGPTDDLVPALGPGKTGYRLSNGEWITNAKAVKGVGGFSGMARLQSMAETGALRQLVAAGFGTERALGGPVGVDARITLPRPGAVTPQLRGYVAASTKQVEAKTATIARAAAEKARKENLYEGSVGTASGWGVLPKVAAVGKIIQRMFNPRAIYGYANRNIAGTKTPSMHKLRRALDFMVFGDRAKGEAIKNFGLANRMKFGLSQIIWHDNIWTRAGNWAKRPYGHPGGFRDATRQHRDHPHFSFDQGGFLPPGASVAVNKTRSPEPVFTPPQLRRLTESSAANGGRPARMHPDDLRALVAASTAPQEVMLTIPGVGQLEAVIRRGTQGVLLEEARTASYGQLY